MPKQSKKAKTKAKQKTQPVHEVPGFTTKKSYWVMLTVLLTAAVSVAGFIISLPAFDVAFLALSVASMIALVGYIRVSPSTLSASRRATFLFVGACFIGFGIYAAIMLPLLYTGAVAQISVALNGDQFFVIPSFIIFLALGAFIGELLGRNGKIQNYLFKPEDTR